MSDWITKYETHPFHSDWNNFLENIDGYENVDLTLDEMLLLRRIKKISVYITELRGLIDAEVMPLSKLDACVNSMNFINRYIENTSYFEQINERLDEILENFRPYIEIDFNIKGKKVVHNAFNVYAKVTSEALNSFHGEMGDILEATKERQKEVDLVFEHVFAIQGKIEELEDEYFVSDSENDVTSVKDQIESLRNLVIKHAGNVKSYHDQLLIGSDNEQSISQSIALAKQSIERNDEKLDVIYEQNEEKFTQLRAFYAEIFGKKNEDDVRVGGLKQELVDRRSELTEFEKEHRAKHLAFNTEIEGLLPGAISAGLASAYLELKNSFEEPKKIYTGLFIGAIGLILLIGIFFEEKYPSIPSSTEPVTSESNYSGSVTYDSSGVSLSGQVSPSEIVSKETPTNHWMSMLNRLLLKLPFILPLIWLAVFAAKRRSEVMRLEQEYAHKEALAKSYQSFKQQIEGLDKDNQELLVKLLDSAITAVSFNASSTLDKNHAEKTPITEVIDKAIDKVMNIKDLGKKKE